MREDLRALDFQAFLSTKSETDFVPVFHALYPRLRRFFLAHGAHLHLAEDLTQDVLFTVYQRADMLRDPALFVGWTYKIARNAMLQHFRRSRPELPLEVSFALACPAQPSPEMEQLQDWISHVDLVSGQIVLLRFVEELSYQEISEALDLPIGTVKWKLFDAKQRLSSYLESQALVK